MIARSLMISVLLFGAVFAHASQIEKAKAAVAASTKIESVSLKSYNCFILSLDATQGKCTMVFEKDGKEIQFLASPEVAALYANPTKYAQVPFSPLNITVSSNEVLKIEDASGNEISKKIDYSR